MMNNVRRNLAEKPGKILAQAQVVVVALVGLAVLLGLSEAVGLGATGASAAILAFVEKLIARPAAKDRAIDVFAEIKGGR